MRLWAFDPVKKVRLFPIESIHYYQPDILLRHRVQLELNNLRQSHLWLVCSCRSPAPMMFIRRKKDGFLQLVNHSEFGLHSDSCPLYSFIKGAPRSVSVADETGDIKYKANKIIFYRAYKEESITEQASTSSSSKVGINSLVRLVWQLADDSHNQFYNGKNVSTSRKLMRLREATQGIHLGAYANLKNYTFVGAKGLNLLKQKLLTQRLEDQTIRHQALLLICCQSVRFDEQVIQIIDHEGSLVIIENVDKAPITINRMGITCSPCLLAVTFTFDDPHDDELACHRWAVFPCLSEDNMIIVSSHYEKMCLDIINNYYDSIDSDEIGESYVVKPTIPLENKTTGNTYLPNFIIVKVINNIKLRCAIVLIETEDSVYMDKMNALVAELISEYESIITLELYRYDNLESMKRELLSKIKTFLIDV